MTRTIPTAAQWKGIGRTAVSLALDVTGATLITTGRVLMFCGLQMRILGARIGPQ